jgi:hypothetical protein
MQPIPPNPSEPNKSNTQQEITSSEAIQQADVNIGNITGSTENPETLNVNAPEFVYTPAPCFPEQSYLDAPIELQGAYGYTPENEPHFMPTAIDATPSQSKSMVMPLFKQYLSPYYPQAEGHAQAFAAQERLAVISHPHQGLIFHPELNLYRDPKTQSYFLFDPQSGLFKDMVSGGFFGYNPVNQLFFNPYTGQYLVPVLHSNTSFESQALPKPFNKTQESALAFIPAPPISNILPNSPQPITQDGSQHSVFVDPAENIRAAAFNNILARFNAPDFNYQSEKVLNIISTLKDHVDEYDKKLLPEEIEALSVYFDKCLSYFNKWNIHALATTLIQLSTINYFEPDLNNPFSEKRAHFLNLLVKENCLKMKWKNIDRRASSVYIHLCLIVNNQKTLSPEITEYFKKFHAEAIENTNAFYLNNNLHLLGYISLIIDKIDCIPVLNALVPVLIPEQIRIKNKLDKEFIVKLLDELQLFIDKPTTFTTKNSDIIHDFIIQTVEKLNENRNLLSADDALKIIRCVARTGYLSAISLNSLINILSIIKPHHINNMPERHKTDMMHLLMCIVAKYSINNDISRHEKTDLTQRIGYLYQINSKKHSLEFWEKTLLSQTAVFLELNDEFPFDTTPTISSIQRKFEDKFREDFPSLTILSEYQAKNLPPADIAIPELSIIVEINGSYHYSFYDKDKPNGRTFLKKYLYKKLGYEVFTINLLDTPQLQEEEYNYITKCIQTSVEARQLSTRIQGIKF